MSERKPKERKPMIQPGSVLGEQPDILSSVLSDYAQATGQPAPTLREETPMPAPVAVEEAPPEEDVVPEAPQPVRPTEPARQQADKPAKQQRPAARTKKVSQSVQDDVEARAATPKRLCSYRIPEGLDDWLEEYAFQNRHSGLKKQDLVAQAIGLLIAANSGSEQDEEQG